MARGPVHEKSAAVAAAQAQFHGAGHRAAAPAWPAGRLAAAGANRVYRL